MYEELEPIANLRIGRAMERIAKTYSEKLVQTNAEFAGRGLSQSGLFKAAKLKLSLDSAQELCRETANTWRDLILRKDGKLSQVSVGFIVSKVSQVGQAQGGHILAASQSGSGGGLPVSGSQQVSQSIQSVLANIRRDLEIERREADLIPAYQSTLSLSREVFIIMAANDELTPLYEQAIAPAVRDNNLEPYLMVEREPDASIANEILSRIESALLIVADLTFERPNCYYEVGHAQSGGKKVIFTARQDHDPRRPGRKTLDPKIHFDLDSHRFSFWDTGDWAHLRTELSKRIGEAVKGIETSSNMSDRIGESGETQVLTYIQTMQAGRPASIVVFDHFVSQGLGWPIDEVRLTLKRLTEKGWIAPIAGGYMLTRR